MKCRLCTSDSCSLFCTDSKRDYIRCNDCNLIFVPEKNFISLSKEKERYHLHNNTINDSEYVKYLQTFANELKRIPVHNPHVLDFGCGPAMVLTQLLQKQGIDCTAYDPLYNIGHTIFKKTFDIVILCEVIEHVRNIKKEVELINKVLNQKGYVLIRIELYKKNVNFTDWWYGKDNTHINFFSLSTVVKFGKLLGKEIYYTNDRNVIILG